MAVATQTPMRRMSNRLDKVFREYGLKGILFIAEDDDAIRTVLKHYFELDGYLIFTAESGKEAIIKLKCMKEVNYGFPDIVITDINMPYNGKKFIQTLSEDNELNKIPLIPMSAMALTSISGKKILKKPFQMEEMKQRIQEIIIPDQNLNPQAESDGSTDR